MRATAFLILLAAPALGSNVNVNVNVNVESTLTFDAEGAKTRPITKVVTLLKDMAKQMEKEADEDQEVYDKTMCWGITNDKEKTKHIADGKAKVDSLTSKIEQLTALSAQTNTEVADLTKEKSEDVQALATATALRQKQIKEFNTQEADILGSIASLKAALVMLHRRSGGSSGGEGLEGYQGKTGFLQLSPLENLMQDPRLIGVLTPSAKRTMAAFVQGKGTPGGAYASQGGEIFGILSQMKETFENNLSESQKEDASNQKAFDDLKVAKEQEIQAGQDQIDAKTQLVADTDEKNAQAAQDLEATKDALSSDEHFLSMLKEKVIETEAQWQERSKTRAAEKGAVQKALEFLTSDEAHALLGRSLNFLQDGLSVHSDMRAQASKVLAVVADKMQSPRLATLAVSVRLDAFTKVKKAIDDMVTELRTEKADEIKHKDFCVDEFDKNELKNDAKIRDKTDVLALVADLKGAIATLKSEISDLQEEIDEMNRQLKSEGVNRENQNKDFQMTISDQRATQKLLKAALGVLKGFYAKKGAAAAVLVQTAAKGGPAPPSGYDEYKKNDTAGGVLGMIQQIIDDSKALEGEATRDEQASQKAYDSFVKTTNDSIETKQTEIADKSSIKSAKEASLVAAQKDRASILLELEQFGIQKADLHNSCDFVIKNFEVRQEARDQEVEALKQAKAILSGAKFEAFLQGA